MLYLTAAGNMGMITDKIVSELQAELEQLQATWTPPTEYAQLRQRMEDAQEARIAYEVSVRGH
jgi:hypothetical protein